jgi:SAM-dependent methyltransferase
MPIRHSERISESKLLPPWLAHEHEARYAFCREHLAGRLTLDCGSGEGKGSRSMARGGPKMMIALDRALDAVALVRGASEGTVRAVNGSAERLPLRRDSLEVIVALEVIEHFDDPDAFLDDVAASLRRDGTFLCSTPNRLVRNPRAPLDAKPLNPWHLREWTPGEFREMLERVFEQVEMYGQSPQSRGVTRMFDAAGAIWKKGAAILRQLVKFRLILWQPRGIYDVQPFGPAVDYEFVVARCSRPRR